MNKIPITKHGAEKLQNELTELKQVARPRIIKAIATAREHGDLKENAEYHAAREQQGFIEGRIKNLESTLSFAEVIDVARLQVAPRIVFGATVELQDEDSDETIIYQIVGELEADIKQARISINSPFARSLIGCSVGDSVEMKIPSRIRRLEIVAVRYVD